MSGDRSGLACFPRVRYLVHNHESESLVRSTRTAVPRPLPPKKMSAPLIKSQPSRMPRWGWVVLGGCATCGCVPLSAAFLITGFLTRSKSEPTVAPASPAVEGKKSPGGSSPHGEPAEKGRLREASRLPHGFGTREDMNAPGDSWSKRQFPGFMQWIYTQRIASLATDVWMEDDSICHDPQAVLLFRTKPELSEREKTVLVIRLNSNATLTTWGPMSVAFAVDGLIYERWTGADCYSFNSRLIGPEPPLFSKPREGADLTLAEKRAMSNEGISRWIDWRDRGIALYADLRREAGLSPISQK